MGDDRTDGGSDLFNAIGAKVGAGAMKVGKKAAESEAGRSATRAAVKGAADGAKQDLTDRYTKKGQYAPPGQPTTTSASAKTAPKPSPAPSQPPKPPAPSQPSKPPAPSHAKAITQPPSRPRAPPSRPKPSSKPFSSSASSVSSSRQRYQPKSAERRVYKHVLSKKADWESLLLVQALFDFRAEMKGDLEFRKGQVVQVITRTENQFDWWEGKIQDRVGIFPANYVKLV